MARFDSALAQVQNGTHDLLQFDQINQLARDEGCKFRNTALSPGNTFKLFVRQIASGNIACSAVQFLADDPFTDTAWCQARKRLPVELIQQANRRLVDQMMDELDVQDDVGDERYFWKGHRLRSIDGTTDSMPDTPALRKHYGVPSPRREGLGFPMSHLMMLMDHKSGLLIDCHDSQVDTHDASVASKVHPHLHEGDVLLGDDAFGSYVHLALLLQAKCHAIMPTHHKRIVDFTHGREHVAMKKNQSKASAEKPRSRWIRSLGKDDQLVEYFKPPNRPAWMDKTQWDAVPGSIVVREIRRWVKRNGFRPIAVTITTTLTDPEKYPADELIELRLTRWMIETNFRHLKITLGMDVLKCKTVEGVRKERLMFILVYNLVRGIMLKAARLQNVNVNRLSFANTLAWLRHGDTTAIAKIKVNPLRPGRLEPRVIKRQKKHFPYMTKPREQLKAQLRALHCDTA